MLIMSHADGSRFSLSLFVLYYTLAAQTDTKSRHTPITQYWRCDSVNSICNVVVV